MLLICIGAGHSISVERHLQLSLVVRDDVGAAGIMADMDERGLLRMPELSGGRLAARWEAVSEREALVRVVNGPMGLKPPGCWRNFYQQPGAPSSAEATRSDQGVSSEARQWL